MTAAEYLITFKFVSNRHQGKCRELETLRESIRLGGAEWRPDSVHAKGISDPTQSAALSSMESVARLTERADALRAEIDWVRGVLDAVEDGAMLRMYYVTADAVDMYAVAAEFGVSVRTAFYKTARAKERLDGMGVFAEL